MKQIIILISYLIFINSSLIASEKKIEDEEYESTLAEITQKIIQRWQYSPQEVDDIYSILVYDKFLDRMDYDRKYLLMSEIKQLDIWREKLDDLVYDYNPTFFNLFVKIWKIRINEIKEYINDIDIIDLDFNKDEFLETNPDKRDYFESKESLFDDWKKRFKFQILGKYWQIIEQDSIKKNIEFSIDLDNEILLESYQKVLKNNNRRFDRLIAQNKNELYSILINAYAQTYDPHTSYFMPQRKEDFDINISGRLEGIGARLSEEDGFIKVIDIIPGGAAWRQGELKIDDLIIEVAQEGEEPVNIVEWRSRDAVKLIRGKKDTEVRLTVNRADGTSLVIPIIRDIIIIEDTYSKSMLLEHKFVNYKIGYITLSKFYHDFKNQGGRNSADDIKLDLIKLNDADVDGLIFDLRNNGGGALDDVVKMGGFFIEDGPIVQVHDRNNHKRILSDEDSSILFNKPLVFIVNQYSASASEILASAMQDYNRAIIVGSRETFGKGTVQRFFDMDRFLSKSKKILSPIGSIKLTIQKFYRINGESTQYKGVEPDIVLPFKNDFNEIGERALDNYLEWDTISKTDYEEFNNRDVELLSILKENSNDRVLLNEFFKEISLHKKILDARDKHTLISLNKSNYLNRMKIEKEEAKNFNSKMADFKEFDLINIVTFKDLEKIDEVELEKEMKFQESLKNDFYLNETIFVLNDLIEHMSK